MMDTQEHLSCVLEDTIWEAINSTIPEDAIVTGILCNFTCLFIEYKQNNRFHFFRLCINSDQYGLYVN